MSKNPILNAVAASFYIALVSFLMFTVSNNAPKEDTFMAPIAAVSLFTLSAAVMGYIFCFTPLALFLDGKKKEGATLFLQTVASFGVITLLAFALLLVRSPKTETEEVHIHAGFSVYIDGKLQDYSDTKYMHIEPCLEEGVEHEEDEQLEKAHMHDNIGNVVHVHRNGATWNDLFINAGISLPQNEDIHLYRRNATAPKTLNEPIAPYDGVIITVGSTKGVDMTNFVSKEYIEEVEQKNESC